MVILLFTDSRNLYVIICLMIWLVLLIIAIIIIIDTLQFRNVYFNPFIKLRDLQVLDDVFELFYEGTLFLIL